MLLCAGAASAEQVQYDNGHSWYFPSQVTLGAGATDPTMQKELSPDVTGELFVQPVGADWWWKELRFRPGVGFNADTGGRTSYGYVGGQFDLINYHHVFFDGFFGVSVHDGELHPNFYQGQTHRALGSRVEFREAATLGYQFRPDWAVSAYIDHQSNAGIFSDTNQGIENRRDPVLVSVHGRQRQVDLLPRPAVGDATMAS